MDFSKFTGSKQSSIFTNSSVGSRTTKVNMSCSKPPASLGAVLHKSHFVLLSYLKPESVMKLTLTSKHLSDMLTDKVLDDYGKIILPEMADFLQKHGVSYRCFFREHLHVHKRELVGYHVEMKICLQDQDGESCQLLEYLPCNSPTLHPKDQCYGKALSLRSICLAIIPNYSPRWLYDDGKARVRMFRKEDRFMNFDDFTENWIGVITLRANYHYLRLQINAVKSNEKNFALNIHVTDDFVTLHDIEELIKYDLEKVPKIFKFKL